jgi:hypothetical protein
MATARDLINGAMKEAGVLGVGQTLNAEDMNDGLTRLNAMLAQWQKKRWIVPSLYDVSAVANNAKSNPIGPNQHYNAARPDKIQAAYFIQNNQAGQNAVSFPLTQIWSYEDYALLSLKELNTWPQYIFYDGAYPYGNVFIWPIPSQDFEVHLICKSPIGFDIQIETLEITANYNLFIDGDYVAVPLLNITGVGVGATVDITVVAGSVLDITIHDGGNGYLLGDILALDMAGIEFDTGFRVKVIGVTDSLDAEFNMPPEYEEAIHYNLSIRLSAMYQYPVNPVSAGLAKLSLNTIKIANAQIPTLKMPAALRWQRGGSFYIFNADAR